MFEHILRLIWNRRRASRLVTLEVAAAFFVVFVVLALALDARANYQRPLGFTYRNVWRVSVGNPAITAQVGRQPVDVRDTIDQILAAIRLLPGVEGAHSIQLTPYGGGAWIGSMGPQGAPSSTRMNRLSAGGAKELGVRIVEGRSFGPEDDGQDYRAALVNRDFVNLVYGGASPLGQRINSAPPGAEKFLALMTPKEAREAAREIRPVGVIEDFRQDGEFSARGPYLILREERADAGFSDLFVRVASGADRRLEEKIVTAVRNAASGFNATVTPWEELRATSHLATLLPLRIGATLAAFLLAMVALGLIGIVWQDVVRRTQEIGVRRAAGASAAAVRAQILFEVMVIGCAGIVIGSLVAIQIPLLSIVKQIDWAAAVPALGLSAVLILLLAAGAALYPARLASRREPADALRYE